MTKIMPMFPIYYSTFGQMGMGNGDRWGAHHLYDVGVLYRDFKAICKYRYYERIT